MKFLNEKCLTYGSVETYYLNYQPEVHFLDNRLLMYLIFFLLKIFLWYTFAPVINKEENPEANFERYIALEIEAPLHFRLGHKEVSYFIFYSIRL